MRIRTTHQVACPACRARIGQPCTGAQGERLPGVHFQRTTAFKRASLEALRALYTPIRNTAAR